MKTIDTMDIMKIISELNTIELDKLYDEIIGKLSEKMAREAHRLGGFKKAAKKIASKDYDIAYATRTDNFKTKVRMLKRLEEVK